MKVIFIIVVVLGGCIFFNQGFVNKGEPMAVEKNKAPMPTSHSISIDNRDGENKGNEGMKGEGEEEVAVVDENSFRKQEEQIDQKLRLLNYPVSVVNNQLSPKESDQVFELLLEKEKIHRQLVQYKIQQIKKRHIL